MSTAVNQRKVVTSLQNAICDLTESELKKFQTYKRIYEESVKEVLSQFPGISELIKGQNSSRLYKYVFGGILRFIAEFTKHNMSPVTMEDVLTYLAYKDIDIMIYCSKKAESFKRFKELIDTLFKHDATIEYHGRDYGSKPPSEFEEDVVSKFMLCKKQDNGSIVKTAPRAALKARVRLAQNSAWNRPRPWQ